MSGPPRPPRSGEKGLTLLEVVIALLLFSMIAIFLLEGHARAADAVLRMQVEREMAELLRLRIDLAALETDEYREGTTEGTFPSTTSTRIIDEEKVLGDRYPGYRWEVTITPMLGASKTTGTVEVQDDRKYEPLFREEGGVASSSSGSGSGDKEEAATVQAEDIDKMLFIQVTVYPPGYDPASDDDDALQPRSAWTAVYLPPEEDTGGPGGQSK